MKAITRACGHTEMGRTSCVQSRLAQETRICADCWPGAVAAARERNLRRGYGFLRARDRRLEERGDVERDRLLTAVEAYLATLAGAARQEAEQQAKRLRLQTRAHWWTTRAGVRPEFLLKEA